MKLEKLGKAVVEAKTKAEYKELMAIFDSVGVVWASGEKATNLATWDYKKQNKWSSFCVKWYPPTSSNLSGHLTCQTKPYFKQLGYKLLTLADFKERVGAVDLSKLSVVQRVIYKLLK